MLNAIRLYRLANWLYRHHIPLLPKLLQLLIFINYNCSISYRMKIGRGTFFNHGGMGVLINPEATVGDNCKIGNNVSIVGQGPYKECPKIGNRVYIGPGAVIQGPVIIEDEVIIAPNAVVNKSVRRGKIVGGIPARIIGDVSGLDYNIFADEKWKEGYKSFLE
ncbi:DapH/DapD/GlmU-related protein [uncultured Duncaniella sp.]|uniref:serine O-acetyltransferase n=1 Tax=uncultured Duncaniella sp. TaxID=2768039 RepID=UPI0025A99340|nr:DapH/DapD/GlmU-related protein [uncultured Duncaniella sp.]